MCTRFLSRRARIQSKELNSIDAYRRMLDLFGLMKRTVIDGDLGADQMIELARAQMYPVEQPRRGDPS